MHCKACDYPLWNLRTHACPECGQAFHPSDFRFAANSVRFCCPDCDQPYFGTTEDGHLDPPEFDCVRCGRGLAMDDMIVRPRADVREEDTAADRMPWLEPSSSGGLFRRWIGTVGMAMGQPVRLMRAVPPGSSLGQAWGFATFSQVVIMALSVVPMIMVMGGFGLFVANAAGGAGGGRPPASGVILGFALAALIGFGIAIFGTLAMLGIWGAVTHGVLAATGGAAQSIGHTYRALCYASGANIVTAVPCLGQYFGWIWWVVSGILMVREGQRVSGLRATMAVLTGPLIMLVLGVAFYGWAVVMALTTAQSAQVAAAGSSDARYAGDGLLAIVADTGAWPAHPLEMIDGYGVGTFIMASTPTSPVAVDIDAGGTKLSDLVAAGDNQRRTMIDAVIAETDPAWAALRVGDAVFTYNGIDPVAGDPALWVVVMAPEAAPDGVVTFVIGEPVMWAVRLDGITVPIQEPVGTVLDAQNALRQAAGLAPIGDPRRIR